MPKGKKICPECSKELGVRTHVCPCGYEFKKKVAPIDLSTASVHVAHKEDKVVDEETENVEVPKKRTKTIKHQGKGFSIAAIASVCSPHSVTYDQSGAMTMFSPVIVNKKVLTGKKLDEVFTFNALYEKVVVDPKEKSIGIWRVIPEGPPDILHVNVLA